MPGTLRTGILGASGYGGAGLIERLGRHAGVRISGIASRHYLGQGVDACWPQFAGLHPDLHFEAADTVIAGSDIVFMATPHGATAPFVKQALDAGKAVIDLSADFRLPAHIYQQWYGAEHAYPELYPLARYGLVEFHREELPGARLVASPGCNATAASLALAPLADAGLLGPGTVATILTGASGAGRTPSQAFHYTEVNDNARPYKVAGTHRHTAEIEAALGRVRAMGKSVATHGPFEPLTVTFNPHLVPMSRGILASCTTRPLDGCDHDDDALLTLYREFYAGDPLVHVQDELPQTKAVSGSDRALVSARLDPRSGTIVAFCAIDNLGKGAAGQAVQAFNLAFDFPETEGLALGGMWP